MDTTAEHLMRVRCIFTLQNKNRAASCTMQRTRSEHAVAQLISLRSALRDRALQVASYTEGLIWRKCCTAHMCSGIARTSEQCSIWFRICGCALYICEHSNPVSAPSVLLVGSLCRHYLCPCSRSCVQLPNPLRQFFASSAHCRKHIFSAHGPH